MSLADAKRNLRMARAAYAGAKARRMRAEEDHVAARKLSNEAMQQLQAVVEARAWARVHPDLPAPHVEHLPDNVPLTESGVLDCSQRLCTFAIAEAESAAEWHSARFAQDRAYEARDAAREAFDLELIAATARGEPGIRAFAGVVESGGRKHEAVAFDIGVVWGEQAYLARRLGSDFLLVFDAEGMSGEEAYDERLILPLVTP